MTKPEANLPPATNPDVGMPAVAAATAPRKRAAAAAPKTRIDGKMLVPQQQLSSSPNRSYKYWIGVTPSCPVEQVAIAGINFPKVNEQLVDDPLKSGERRRIPVIGAVVNLTRDKIERLVQRLPMTVIRFTDDQGTSEESGSGVNIGDVHQRPRRGQLISIPSDEEIAARVKRGRAVHRYTASDRDAPAARFMFAILCEDQARGNRGEYYPESLEVTGLEWPGEM